ncbi:hypothetical protein ANN_10916 [Periplaneta americana]|uniref:Uncharacterized protein n=1 Tax=Periplaneta americana TaxID=6978 RepID=A0ABQ8T4S4_PERAM|nr:hypothetical protein ANN_10916 [Periplaneta americana]
MSGEQHNAERLAEIRLEESVRGDAARSLCEAAQTARLAAIETTHYFSCSPDCTRRTSHLSSRMRPFRKTKALVQWPAEAAVMITESYPAFARIGLRENPGKNLNQIICPDRDSNPRHLVSRPDALTVTPQHHNIFLMPDRYQVKTVSNKVHKTTTILQILIESDVPLLLQLFYLPDSASALLRSQILFWPDFEWIKECNENGTSICLNWFKGSQLQASLRAKDSSTQAKVSCSEIVLRAPQDREISACMQLDGAQLYGGGIKGLQYWPSQHNIKDHVAYVTGMDSSEGVVEPYWLTSSGIAVFVPPDVPLFVSQNKTHLCLAAKIESPYLPDDTGEVSLQYHLCSGSDPVTTHMHATQSFLPLPRDIPAERVFRHPIWSTWARYKKNINTSIVSDFADQILHYGFNNSQLEIDDNWETCYGSAEFDVSKFEDPKGLVQSLKNRGFHVTLWTHPFFNLDCPAREVALQKHYLCTGTNNSETLTKWWNGVASMINITNPEAATWWADRLVNIIDSSDIRVVDAESLGSTLEENGCGTALERWGFCLAVICDERAFVVETRSGIVSNYVWKRGRAVESVDRSTVSRWASRLSGERGQANIPDTPRSGTPCTARSPDNVQRFDNVVVADKRVTVKELSLQGLCQQKKFKTAPLAEKIMAAVFYNSEGLLLVDIMLHGTTINSNVYVATVKKLQARLSRVRPHREKQYVLLLHDNVWSHVSHKITDQIRKLGWATLKQSTYSPDLAQCDYHLFGKLKESLRGTSFEDDDSLVHAAKEWLKRGGPDFYRVDIQAPCPNVEYNFDDFKYDAGEAGFLPGSPETVASISDQKAAEVRVVYRNQGEPIFARMSDKKSTWDTGSGLKSLVTTLLAMNMVGYSFVMPDMVGGNGYGNFPDKELFIRWLQANTFMPTIQFSFAPWDYDDETVEIAKKFTSLHYQYSDKILELARKKVADGTPINLPLWWLDPTDEETLTIDSADIHRQLCEVYGDDAISDGMVRRWVRKFNEGRVSVHDEQRIFDQ